MHHLQCGDDELTDEWYQDDEGVQDAVVDRCCEDECNRRVIEEGVKCWDCWSGCVNGSIGVFNGCQEELDSCQEKVCGLGEKCTTVRYELEGDYIGRMGCEGSVEECANGTSNGATCNQTMCSGELCNADTLAEECAASAINGAAENIGTVLGSWLLLVSCFGLHCAAFH